MQYREDGYLPDALINYLARLGWSHGDEEIFTREQLVEWFDFSAINRSPAKFNPEKLQWLNQQYLKTADDVRLAELVRPFLEAGGCNTAGQGKPNLPSVANLLKERVNTVAELADAAVYFFRALEPAEELKAQHFTAEVKQVILELRQKLAVIEWASDAINDAIKTAAKGHGLKMPKVAMPLRVMVAGVAQTPSINAVLELLGREETLKRMDNQLADFPA
jgi:glutamyl-tRNA synthetase